MFTSTYANYVIVLDYISAVNANDTLKFQGGREGQPIVVEIIIQVILMLLGTEHLHQ